MARQNGEESAAMTKEGDEVRQRRERLGLDKKELAELAKVHRTTVAAIEEGQGSRRGSLAKIERALTMLEDEAGINAPPLAPIAGEGELVEFSVADEMGLHIVVKGPLSDADALRRQVVGLVREIREAQGKGDTPGPKVVE